MEASPHRPIQMLTTREVQSRLCIGRSTLYDFLDSRSPRHQPDLPKPVRIGGSTRFYEHEIDAYLLRLAEERRAPRR